MYSCRYLHESPIARGEGRKEGRREWFTPSNYYYYYTSPIQTCTKKKKKKKLFSDHDIVAWSKEIKSKEERERDH